MRVCVCVCVSMCVSKRARVCMCVCVYKKPIAISNNASTDVRVTKRRRARLPYGETLNTNLIVSPLAALSTDGNHALYDAAL